MSPYGQHATAFRRLRVLDPERNLRERWAFLQEHAPELAASLPFVPLVLSRGWAIGGSARVACSVGLSYRFAHPELVLCGPREGTAADTNSLRAATDSLAQRAARGEPWLVEDQVSLESVRVVFKGTLRVPTTRQLAVFPCTAILRFEELFGDIVHDAARPPVLWATVRRRRRGLRDAG